MALDAELRGAVRFVFDISFVGPEFNNSLAESIIDSNLDTDFEVVQFLDVASSQEINRKT